MKYLAILIGVLLLVCSAGAAGNDATTSVLLHFNTSTSSENDAAGTQLTFNAMSSPTNNGTAPLKFYNNAQFDSNQLNANGNSQLLNFSDGNFTIDFWINPRQSQGAYRAIFGNWYINLGVPTSGGLEMDFGAGGGFTPRLVYDDQGSTRIITMTSALPQNQWTHIAIVGVNGGALTIYNNGVANGSYATHNIKNESYYSRFDIGDEGGATASYPIQNVGLDEFRIMKGTAYWTSDFTPPTSEYSGVAAVQLPIPSFTTNSTGGVQPVPVQFNDTSATSITNWSWDFGEGNASTIQNPTNTFYNGNNYVTLNVTNASGSSTTPAFAWINVTAPSITANFTGTPLVGTPGTSVTFTDTTTGNGISAWTYNWSFGDGTVNTTANPTHVYSSNGVYDVNLTVYNSTVGYSTKLRTGYITISSSGGLSGFNRQDIMMDQIFTVTFLVKDSSTHNGIPGAIIQLSNGDSTTTDLFGSANFSLNYSAIVAQFAATGYQSRSISYVIDRDRTETIYLTPQAATVNSSANTNIVYVPKQIEIVVMYYDPAGNVVPGAHVDLTAIANTLQADSQLETLYGINPTAANQLMNGTLVMHGTTDASGGIVFTILQSINYQAQVTDPKDSKVYTATLFPGSDPYTIWIGTNPIKNQTPTNQAYMNQTRLFVTQSDPGNVTDNLIYRDLSGKTQSVTFVVKYASNGTIAYSSTQAVSGTNAVYMNYTHPNIRGMGIFYGWNATKVS